jgi:hypothetical protein
MTTPLSPAERNTLRMADLTFSALAGGATLIEIAATPDPSPAQDAETITGFDYTNQAWVQNGRYVPCGHLDEHGCNCFGKLNAGRRPSRAIVAEMIERYNEETSVPLAPRYGLQAGRCITIDGVPAFTLIRPPIADRDGNGTPTLSPVELDDLTRRIVELLNG